MMRLAALGVSLMLWMSAAALAARAESAPPDRKMLRMMDFLRDMEMIKQIDMLQDMHNLAQGDVSAKAAPERKSAPANKRRARSEH